MGSLLFLDLAMSVWMLDPQGRFLENLCADQDIELCYRDSGPGAGKEEGGGEERTALYD
jgi:hypothetical protein